MKSPLGLLHEPAYTPMDSWRAQVAQVAQSPEPPDHHEPDGSCGLGPLSHALVDQALLASDPPDPRSWQVCLWTGLAYLLLPSPRL